MSELLWLSLAFAQPLSVEDVAARILDVDPTVTAARVELDRAALAVRGEQHRYGLRVGAGVSAERAASPRMFGDTAFVGTSDSLVGSLDLTVEAATGTDVVLAVDGSRGTSTSLLATSLEPLTNGPTSTVQTRLTVRQDLASPGLTWGATGLRQARAAEDQASARALDVASAAVRDGLLAWWELAYADAALAIEVAALADARRDLAEAEARVRTGSSAPVDALASAQAVATREEGVATAAAERQRRMVAVMRALDLDGPPELGAPVWSTGAAPDPGEAVEAAQARSASVAASRAALTLAREQARTAGASLRPTLAAEGWLQSDALVDVGGASVGPTEALSLYAGLTGTFDVDRARYRAERERGALAVTAAAADLVAAERTVARAVEEAGTKLTAAEQRIALAERTVGLARAQRDAARARVGTGSELALALREAEAAVREAELRSLRARVDRESARLNLGHLTGALVDGG